MNAAQEIGMVGRRDRLASDLAAGYLWPADLPAPIPSAISRVVAAMAAAVLARPANLLPGTQSLQTDEFGVTFAPGIGAPGPHLTAALRVHLRPYRGGTTSVAMGSEGTSRPRGDAEA